MWNLLKCQIKHADPPRNAHSKKTQTTKKFLIIRRISKKQLSYYSFKELIQILNKKWKIKTWRRHLTDRWIRRTKSSGEVSDPDDVKIQFFINDDTEIQPIIEKQNAWLNNVEKELIEKNQTKRAATYNHL